MSRGVKPYSRMAKRNAKHRASTTSALRLAPLISSAGTLHTEAHLSMIKSKIWFLVILFILLCTLSTLNSGATSPIGQIIPLSW